MSFILSPSIKRAIALLAVIALITLIVTLVAHNFRTSPLSIKNVENQSIFTVGRDGVFFPGQCVDVQWDVPDAELILLGMDEVDSHGERTFCIYPGHMPTLTVISPEGAKLHKIPVDIGLYTVSFWLKVIAIWVVGVVLSYSILPYKYAVYTAAGSLTVMGVVIGGVILHRGLAPMPIAQHFVTDDGHFHIRSDQSLVALPGDEVEVEWLVEDAAQLVLYPMVEPGIENGQGVRDVFFRVEYAPVPYIPPEADRAIIQQLNGTLKRGNDRAVIDYRSQPKYRVYFDENDAIHTYKPDVDVAFLRLETWLLLVIAWAFIATGDLLIGYEQSRRRHSSLNWRAWTLRLLVITSVPIVFFYSYVFVDYGLLDLLRTYWLDIPVILALTSLLAYTVFRGIYRDGMFDTPLNHVKNTPRSTVAVGVLLVWLWALGFGYQSRFTINPYLWLPLYIWFAIIGCVFVSFSKVETIHKSPSLIRRGAIILAVIFMALSLTRDGLLFWAYGTEPGEDGHSYINRGEILFDRTASTESGIPPRTFPYLFINAITRSYESQDLLAITQYFIAAIAIGAITYVLARRNWLIAAAVGLVLALDLVWGLYSRQAMTESLFISFHLIALAVLIHHYYLRDAAPRWLLILAGLLFFWTFLMRGSGIVLILPTYFIYIFLVKSWRKALWVLIGASVLGLSIATFNLWRWGEFGLLGDQHDTLASALFSYNLFSPENGAESAKLHSDLAACMPYIDYDDVPRYRNVFIYIHLNPCLLGEDTYTIDARNDLTSRVGAALQELIRSRPFDFGREVLAEIITLVAFPVSEEWFPFAFSPAESCVDEACTEYVVLKLDRDNQALIDLNKILTVPRQIYQSIAWTSSHSEVVLFAAWAMLGLFALLVSRGSHRFILLICGGFIVYHFLTTALVHTFKSRYTVSLIGFYTVASVIIGYYILTSVRSVILNMRWRRAAGYAVIGYCVLYLFFANPALRVNVTAPITASVMPAVANMFRKFGVSDDEYRLYDHMASLDGDAATISWQPPTSLHQSNFREEYADLYSKWIQNYLPGYLHLAGIEYLVVSDGEWNTLSVEAQAVFNNPQHYMLEMELKTANGEEGALYRVVGDQFGTIILHEQDDFVLFEQPDGAIHVLQLDENREGRFIGRIEPWRLRNGAYQPDEVDSWRVELMSDAQEEFTISVIDTIDRITYPIDYTLIYQPLR